MRSKPTVLLIVAESLVGLLARRGSGIVATSAPVIVRLLGWMAAGCSPVIVITIATAIGRLLRLLVGGSGSVIIVAESKSKIDVGNGLQHIRSDIDSPAAKRVVELAPGTGLVGHCEGVVGSEQAKTRSAKK